MYLAHLRTLFWIAVSNFVIPVIFNVLLIIFAFREANMLDGTYLFLINVYIAVISALLATLWCSSTHWMAAGDEDAGVCQAPPSAITFAPVESEISSHPGNSSEKIESLV